MLTIDFETYPVREIFYTLQGEGAHIGTPAVFVRFAGCNLWSGREEDRADAVCRFCDTDFLNGTKYCLDEIVATVRAHGCQNVVFTGGEPGLQLNSELIAAFPGYHLAVETNGTVLLPRGLDWVCVSPKAGTHIRQTTADELKLVYPQDGLSPGDAAEMVDAPIRWLSPMAGPDWAANVAAAVAYAKANAGWRVNIQAHKFWRIS
jgi:7-carboxy-7-deazaguanine synthase (Cx14CxxC type)